MKRFLMCILCFMMIGCAAQADDLTDAPEVTEEPTEHAEVTATAAASATVTVTATTESTEAVTPRPTRTGRPPNPPVMPGGGLAMTVEDCLSMIESLSVTTLPPPDLSALRWETGSQGERRLTGLTLLPRNLLPSPDGRYLAATFFLGNGGQIPISATALIDTQGSDHRLLSNGEDLVGHEHFYTWLPDGRLLWIDGTGQVFLDDQNLNAPEPMRGIHYVVGDIAFISPNWGAPEYRVDLNSGQWEIIATPDGMRPGLILGISADERYALLVWGDTANSQAGTPIWRVPLQMGAPAEYLFSHDLEGVGTDGYLGVRRAEHLPGTSIWVMRGPYGVDGGSDSYALSSVILDISAKRILTPEDFGLSADYVILGGTVDAESGSLVVDLTKDPRYAENTAFSSVADEYYLVRGGDLKGGTLSTEWPLPAPSQIAVPDGSIYIATSQISDPPFVIAQQDTETMIFHRYDAVGNSMQTLDLSAEFQFLFGGSVLSPDEQTVYLPLMQPTLSSSGCTNIIMLVAWDVSS